VCNRLVIMAKRPGAGRVKTRLARDVGTGEALRFYRRQLADICRRLSNRPGWRTLLALAPDSRGARLDCPVDEAVGQGGGDLGQRMQRLFDHCGRGPLIIIGADIPDIRPQMISRAFHLLASHDMVFGPAPDGGYWLIGQSRRPRVLSPFVGVRWSTPNALCDTLANVPDHAIAFVDQLNDIDTGADLRNWSRRFSL